MPIYEYCCQDCHEIFERLELSIVDIPSSQCPTCAGVGTRLMSRPSLVYELMDGRAVHKLPDWDQKQRAAQGHDAQVRRQYGHLPPLQRDRGKDIKVYETEFGYQERRNLERHAQLDNMP
jgi:putative FmdB family regulatory protein